MPNIAKIKTFVHRARLVKGERWYIDFQRFDAETGAHTRHRHDFDLNDIADLEVREMVGERLVRYIDLFASMQPVATKKPASAEKTDTQTVKDAVSWALSAKKRLPRKNSYSSYRTVSRALLAWCERVQYAGLPVAEFGKKHARAFWEHLRNDGARCGRTLNNYRTALHGLWSEMADAEMVTENPWAKIKTLRCEEKKRRPFTDEERRIVAAEVEKCDYWLFRGLLLQFFCYIRPVELTRLKFKDFDFSTGTIRVREEVHKKWRSHTKTLPKSILPYFLDGKFERYPVNYFVFGRVGGKGHERLQPGMVAIDENRMYKRHAKILARLKADGRLSGDISGLTWYSWKDTGISMHTRRTSPVATKDQAGHTNLAATSAYYHAENVIGEYRTLENDLF